MVTHEEGAVCAGGGSCLYRSLVYSEQMVTVSTAWSSSQLTVTSQKDPGHVKTQICPKEENAVMKFYALKVKG